LERWLEQVNGAPLVSDAKHDVSRIAAPQNDSTRLEVIRPMPLLPRRRLQPEIKLILPADEV
jgi:hypothetical protein